MWGNQSKRGFVLGLFAAALIALAGCGGSDITDAHQALANGETEKAIELYEEQAEDGNVVAMRSLGTIYMTGNGVPKDYDAAEQWFKQAVAAGDGQSETLLQGVQNLRKAEASQQQPTTAQAADNSKARECASDRSACRTACAATPSAGYGGYGGSSRSSCYNGCEAKYQNCLK